jgi:elongation factor P
MNYEQKSVEYEVIEMPKACELKKGIIVEINGMPHLVKQLETKSPSSRGASTLYKVRFTNLQTGQKLDESYKGDDFLKEADCLRTQVQYSYLDGDTCMFMNMEDFSQYGLNRDELEGQVEYLTEGMEGITALLMDGVLLGIELPQSVALTIVDTAPGIKGATATGRTKPATLSTGLEIQVPEYLESGETVKVNTLTGKFISRE